VEEVHRKGGKLFLQIFHGGRISHPKLNGGYESWAPSAIAARGEKIYYLGGEGYPTPKEMTIEDIEFTKQ
jgi:2,4-dienoyl-CoA reductase-like NADH-dependent reductase (Old Yellow Enzyme family)